MKKIFSILMIVSVMSLVLGGCGAKEPDATTPPAAPAADAAPPAGG